MMGERVASGAERAAALVDRDRAAMAAVRLTMHGWAIRVARNMETVAKKLPPGLDRSRLGADAGLLARAQPCGPTRGHQCESVGRGES